MSRDPLDNRYLDEIEVGDIVEILGRDEWFAAGGMDYTIGAQGTVLRIRTNGHVLGTTYCKANRINPDETYSYRVCMADSPSPARIWVFQSYNVKLVKKKRC